MRCALICRSHGELGGPGLTVSGGFVSALNDLLCERGMKVHRCADHVGRNLDLAALKNFEEPRQTFFEAVVVPFARRQIWILRIDLRHRAFGSAGRLCAGLHLHRDGDDHASAVRPESAYGTFVLFGAWVAESDRRWYCPCYSCHCSRLN